MTIEFLYFDGCPSYVPALQNLKKVVSDNYPDAKIKPIRINSIEDAEQYNFQGSPSIRVDGRDLEDKNDGYSYNCRLYQEHGKLTGVPSEAFIRKQINHISGAEKKSQQGQN